MIALAACANETAELAPDVIETDGAVDAAAPMPDAAADVDAKVDATSSPEASVDAGLDVGERDAKPDNVAPDAKVDAVTVEASVDAGLDVAPEAGNVPEASAPDSARDAKVDAGSDAKPDAAAPIDAPSDVSLPCTSSPATCDSANRAEAAIRATYQQPCITNDHQCGGVVQDGTAVTYPMTCKATAWSLAWCLNAACYACSSMCPVGQLCPP
jgi:hypothetical protein